VADEAPTANRDARAARVMQRAFSALTVRWTGVINRKIAELSALAQ